MYNVVGTYLFACNLTWESSRKGHCAKQIFLHYSRMKTKTFHIFFCSFCAAPCLHQRGRQRTQTYKFKITSLMYYFDNYIFWNDVTYAQDSKVSLFHRRDANVIVFVIFVIGEVAHLCCRETTESDWLNMLTLPFVLMSGEGLFLSCCYNFTEGARPLPEPSSPLLV